MKLSIYLLPDKVGLKFQDSQQRDSFFASFPQPNALEKVASRTIRINPSQITDPGWQLEVEAMDVPAPTQPPPAVEPTPTPAAPAPQKTGDEAHLVRVDTGNPFAITGEHVTRPLPGLVPEISNITEIETVTPPVQTVTPEMQNATPAVQSASPALQNTTPEVQTEAPLDPEPPDKRTKEWKQWKARQK